MSDLTIENVAGQADILLKSALTNLANIKSAQGDQPGQRLFFPNGIELIYLAFNVKDIGLVTLAIAGKDAKYPNPTSSHAESAEFTGEPAGGPGFLTTRRLNLFGFTVKASPGPRQVKGAQSMTISVTCEVEWHVDDGGDNVSKTMHGKHSGEHFYDDQGKPVFQILKFKCRDAGVNQVYPVTILDPQIPYKSCWAKVIS